LKIGWPLLQQSAFATRDLKGWKECLKRLNVSHRIFFSGSFDQGSDSFVSFGANGKLIEVHVGATKSNQFVQCGKAVEYDGIVIDSF